MGYRPAAPIQPGSFGADVLLQSPGKQAEMQPLIPGTPGVDPTDLAPNVLLENTRGLSTFQGVFVPCCLSIFSVVLFLRLGYIVGQAGLVVTLAMLVLAYTIVGLTILSISAISTNGLVRGGGAYYMISRSLGPEFGGSIGIIFFFANVFSSGLYVAGFVEAICQNIEWLPNDQWSKFGYGSATLCVCLVVCLVGANAFAKASLLIWGVVMISVASATTNFFYAKPNDMIPCPSDNNFCKDGSGGSMYNSLGGLGGGFESIGTGGETEFGPDSGGSYWVGKNETNETYLSYTGFNKSTLHSNLWPSWGPDYTNPSTGSQDIQMVFALLFNGCTGIMAGANISGDLKNASKSIPWGTMAASAFTFVVYVIIFSMTAATCSNDLLKNNYSYLQMINKVAPLIIMGVFSATLSAALSCLIGASRILQAISKDNLLGDWFLVFSVQSKKGEPIRAVFFAWMCVQCVLLIGNINVIAPLVSMMYLVTYGIVNFACFLLAITGAPNFRPRFKQFTWHTAFGGFVGCIAVMFYSKPTYATGAVVLMIGLFLLIHFRHVPVSWGDVSQALIYHQVRKYLLRLEFVGLKYWRPQILLLTVNPRTSFEALRFANDMKKGGLYIVGRVLVGKMNRGTAKRQVELQKAWNEMGKYVKIKTFADICIADSVRMGVQSLLSASGLGGMRPNIVFLGNFREECDTDQLASFRLTLGKKSVFDKPVDLKAYDQVVSKFPQLGEDEEYNKAPSAKEYVGIVNDCLLMNKSLGILFHMAKVESSLRTAEFYPEPYYIDVWLWPNATTTESDRRTSELLMQLVWIIHRVKRWKRVTQLRVLAAHSRASHAEEQVQCENRIKEFIQDLRIDALVSPVELEDTSPNIDDFASLNATMREKSSNTCLIVAKLPPPPSNPSRAQDYIDSLNLLTDALPPTVLLSGVENVSTKFDHAV